jgi:hypothetical protein
VVFEVDHVRRVFPYDNRLLQHYDIDWTVVSVTPLGDGRVRIRLPDFSDRRPNGAGGSKGIEGIVPLRVTGYGFGVSIGEVGMAGDIIDVRDNAIVLVVGFFPERP